MTDYLTADDDTPSASEIRKARGTIIDERNYRVNARGELVRVVPDYCRTCGMSTCHWAGCPEDNE